MARDFSFKILTTYLEDLVDKTDYIKKYIGISPEELQNELANYTKMDFPIMVFFGYEGSLSGNNQRTNGSRTVYFSILFQCNPDDYRDQETAYDTAELYGLNILSRIRLDSEVQKYKWLADAFDKNSVQFDIAQFENAESLFGMVFSFDMNSKDPLNVDPLFWNDRDDFCNYP